MNGTNGIPEMLVKYIFALIGTCLWVYYLIFWNSRLWGFVLTAILRRFAQTKDIAVGSVAISVLTGKIVFRDFRYVTANYSIRAVDGLIWYRWWIPTPRNNNYIIRLLSPRAPLKVNLHGLKIHLYNRVDLYDDLNKLFKSRLLQGGNRSEKDDESGSSTEEETDGTGDDSYAKLRQLIPAIQINVSMGKLSFGNHLVPTTLSCHVESATGLYTTTKASCDLDPFQHILRATCKRLKVKLSNSSGYKGTREEPPKYIGSGGFILAQSSSANIEYCWDEPGRTPSSGYEDAPFPKWGVDLKLGPETSFTYGPWVNRQRVFLQKFFYPPDYRTSPVTKLPSAGQRRVYGALDCRIEMVNGGGIDVLFSKAKHTVAMNVQTGSKSYFHYHYPWIVKDDGFTCTLNGSLKQVEATASLDYRRLAEAKEINLNNMTFYYPRKWNGRQVWDWSIEACEVTVRFIYPHIHLFHALMSDWSGSGHRPDVLDFVPMDWRIGVDVRDFELLTFVNQCNWIDVASPKNMKNEPENSFLAFCGQRLTFSTFFPFRTFQQRTEQYLFNLNGEKVVVRLRVPASHGCSSSIRALNISSKPHFEAEDKIWNRFKIGDSSPSSLDERKDTFDGDDLPSTTWAGATLPFEGWFDCIFAPRVTLQFDYTSHSAVIYRDESFGDSTNFVEDDYDKLHNHMEVTVGVRNGFVRLFGTLVKHFLWFKEDYFGSYQTLHVFDSSAFGQRNIADVVKENKTKPRLRTNHLGEEIMSEEESEATEKEAERYLEISFHLHVNDATAQLPLHMGTAGSPKQLPVIKVPNVSFEFIKGYTDGRLTLDVGPVSCSLGEAQQSSLSVCGLLIMGHGHYSDFGSVLLEYAWLVDIQCRSVAAEMSSVQLQTFLEWIDAFVSHIADDESDLQRVESEKEVIKTLSNLDLSKLSRPLPDNEREPLLGQLKYEFVRAELKNVEVRLLDGEDCCSLIKLKQLSMATCNFHSVPSPHGFTIIVEKIRLSQLASEKFLLQSGKQRLESTATSSFDSDDESWREVGSIDVPNVTVEISVHDPSLASLAELQLVFLVFHDRLLRRLWFLYEDGSSSLPCGCYGGCQFFDSVRPPSLSLQGPSDSAERFHLHPQLSLQTLSPSTSSRGRRRRRLSRQSQSTPVLLKRSQRVDEEDEIDAGAGAGATTTTAAADEKHLMRLISSKSVTSVAESFHSCQDDFDLPDADDGSRTASTSSFVSALSSPRFSSRNLDFGATPDHVPPFPLPSSSIGDGPKRLKSFSVDPFFSFPKYVMPPLGRKRRKGVRLFVDEDLDDAGGVSSPLASLKPDSTESNLEPSIRIRRDAHVDLKTKSMASGRLDLPASDNDEVDRSDVKRVSIVVQVRDVDVKLSSICLDVACRHVESIRRRLCQIHPLRVVDALRGRLVAATKQRARRRPAELLDATSTSTVAPEELFDDGNRGEVCAKLTFDAATVSIVELGNRRGCDDALFAGVVGCVETEILSVPSKGALKRTDVVVIGSIAYVHGQLCLLAETSFDSDTSHRVAFDVVPLCVQASSTSGRSTYTLSHTSVVELGLEGVSVSTASACVRDVDGAAQRRRNATALLSSIWIEFPTTSANVISVAIAWLDGWLTRGLRFQLTLSRLQNIYNERFVRTAVCLLTQSLCNDLSRRPCTSKLTPLAFLLHQSVAVQILPYLRLFILQRSLRTPIERLVQSIPFPALDDVVKALVLAWGGKFGHQGDLKALPEPVPLDRRRSSHIFRRSSSVGLAISSQDGSRAGSVERQSFTSGENQRRSSRFSRRASFYSLFSSRQATSAGQSTWQRSANMRVLDDLAKGQDLSGYVRGLIELQSNEQAAWSTTALQPLARALGVKERTNETVETEGNRFNFSLTMGDVSFSLRKASDSSTVTSVEGIRVCGLAKRVGGGVDVDVSLAVTVGAVRQEITVLLLQFTRELAIAGRAEAESIKSAMAKNRAGALASPSFGSASIDDADFVLLTDDLVEAYKTKQASLNRRDFETTTSSRGDGDGAVDVETIYGEDESVPVRDVSPVSVERQRDRLSGPLSIDDDASSIEIASLGPPGERGEGVGKEAKDAVDGDARSIGDDGWDWKAAARAAKRGEFTESHYRLTTSALVEKIVVAMAVESLKTALTFEGTLACLTAEGNRETSRDEENEAADVAKCVSLSVLVPLVDVSASDSVLEESRNVLLSGSVSGLKLVASNVTRSSQGDHTSLMSTVDHADINLPQSVVALHSSVKRNVVAVTKEAESMISLVDQLTPTEEEEEKVIGATKEVSSSSSSSSKKVLHSVVFIGKIKDISFSACLLPSLSASYKIAELRATANDSDETSFSVDACNHEILFSTTADLEQSMLPRIGLPDIAVRGQIVDLDEADASVVEIDISVEAITFDLTTDSAKNLAVVQQKFVKEGVDLLKRLTSAGGVFSTVQESSSRLAQRRRRRSLVVERRRYLHVNLGINKVRISALTPTSAALHLRTGLVRLWTSNNPAAIGVANNDSEERDGFRSEAHLNLTLSLESMSQFVVDRDSEELNPPLAYFKTTASFSSQTGESGRAGESGAEGQTVFLTFRRPHFFVQPLAFDKAILVWLKYKEAFDYILEHQKEVSTEMHEFQSVIQRQFQARASKSASSLKNSRLLKVQLVDFGACFPIINPDTIGYESDLSGADLFLILTVREAHLAVLLGTSVQPTVSMGEFSTFAVRLDEKFDSDEQTWVSPDDDLHLNCGRVPKGSYKLHLDLRKAPEESQEEGQIDVSGTFDMIGLVVTADSRIGQYVFRIARSLTALAASEVDDDDDDSDDSDDDTENVQEEDDEAASPFTQLPSFHTVPPTPTRTTTPLRFDSVRRARGSYQRRQSSFSSGFDVAALQRVLRAETQCLEDMIARGIDAETRERQERVVKEVEESLETRRKHKETTELSKPPSSAGIVITDDWNIALTKKRPSDGEAVTTTTEKKQRVIPRHLSPPPIFNIAEESGSRTTIGDDETDSSTAPKTQYASQHSLPSSSGTMTSQPEWLAFKLDVQIGISSGQCILVPVNGSKLGDEQRIFLLRRARVAERPSNFSVASGSSGSFLLRRRLTAAETESMKTESIKLPLPAISIQLHYHAESGGGGGGSGSGSGSGSGDGAALSSSFGSLKRESARRNVASSLKRRGKAYAKLVMKSMPEFVVRSSLLKFVETALEPIQFEETKETAAAAAAAAESASPEPIGDVKSVRSGLSSVSNSGASSSQYVVSFPIDLTVVINVDPHRIRLSGSPVSNLECVVKLPAIRLVCSSITQDDVRTSSSVALLRKRSEGFGGGVRSRSESPLKPQSTVRRGVSLVGHLSDFAVMLLHPLKESMLGGDGATSGGGSGTPGLKPRGAESMGGNLKHLIHVRMKSLKLNLARHKSCEESHFANELKFPDEVGRISTVSVSALADVDTLDFLLDMRRMPDVYGFMSAWSHSSLIDQLLYGRKRSGSGGRTKIHPGDSTDRPWQSTIGFSVVVSSLYFEAYVGQLLGKTKLETARMQLNGGISVDYKRRRSLRSRLNLEAMDVNSVAGAIGGCPSLRNLEGEVGFVRGEGCDPLQRIRLFLGEASVRLERLSTPFLMARLTDICMTAKDRWESMPADDACHLILEGEVGWNELELAVTNNTAPSIADSLRRIEDFIRHQRTSTQRALGDFLSPARRHTLRRRQEEETTKLSEDETDYLDSYHWKWVTKVWSDLLDFLELDASHSPRLAGALTLRGNRFALACLHGSGFRDAVWALFIFEKLTAAYETLALFEDDAMELAERKRSAILVPQFASRQRLHVTLGAGAEGATATTEFLTVQKVRRRNVLPVTTKSSVDAWLRFLCRLDSCGSGFDGKESFKTLAFPAFALNLRTTHYWPPGLECRQKPPEQFPLVYSDLTTSFTDSIAVTTVIERYLFLQDLIKSYIAGAADLKSSASIRTRLESDSATPSADSHRRRIREFRSVRWHVDPLIKLVMWGGAGGGHVNPHVNWLLEMLGFKQARTTVPKWIQRGLMDPLDMIVANALAKIAVHVIR